MKTIIAGSRDAWPDDVENAMSACPFRDEITEVISGGAVGADSLGESWARRREISVQFFPADWERYGRAAGPIRNKQMADNAEALIAIWDGKSRGTKNMIEIAKDLHLQVFVYNFSHKGRP